MVNTQPSITLNQNRVIEFEEKRRATIAEAGFRVSSMSTQGSPCDGAFNAVITYRDKKSFMVEYDGWGGNYNFYGDKSLVNKFGEFANTVILPLDVEHETLPIMKEIMTDSKWDAKESTVAFMIDEFERMANAVQ